MASLTRADLAVLDPETYANGDPTTFGRPLDQYRSLREEEPVCLHEFDDELLLDRVWVVSRWEDINTIDRDSETFSAAQGLVNYWKFAPIGKAVDAPAILTLDGDEHRGARKIVSRGFTPKMVQAL